MTNFFRLPFLFLAMACLLLGLWTGLIRIGWELNTHSFWSPDGGPWNVVSYFAVQHGAIMVGGFLGTLISIEKIIPLKNRLLFIIPVLSASSILFFAVEQPVISFTCLILSGVGLTLVFLRYLRHEKNLIYVVMMAGSLCWVVGNIFLLTRNLYPFAFPWWLGFILFVITAERLELMKFLPVTKNNKILLACLLTLFLSGAILSFHGIGKIISGCALTGIALWLMRYDLVGIAIRKDGLPRFVAVALLIGYVAMLLTGIFFIALQDQWLAYDAIVHTFFLGFVFSMIFAHGPIILPGVLGISAKPYHPLLYGWLVMLHTSWILRVMADLSMDFATRKISGLLSVIAILGYFATIAILTSVHQRRAQVL